MTPLPLTDPNFLRSLLAKERASPKHAMGQNFLISNEVIEATVLAAQEGPKNVTELGPGVGVLTQALILNDFSIRAIEKDDTFAHMLTKRKYSDVEILHKDLQESDWTWPDTYQIVGNIPYNLSGYIIRHITELSPKPSQAIVMVQQEVGERVSASAPNMSLLSLGAQLWGNVELLLNVPRDCFWPQPNVDSALIRMTPRTDAPDSETVQKIMDIARMVFQQKRKQLGKTLAEVLGNKDKALASLEEAGILPNARPEELSPKNWEALITRVDS